MTRTLFALIFLLSVPAYAEGIKYYEDPVYKKLNAEDSHPMEDMLTLAKDGDVRAQFILGDLYAKGKGGFVRDEKKARQWFETSARQGYAFSFIRLAALEKHHKDPAAAYKWYTLAVDRLGRGPDRKWAIAARQALVEKSELSEKQMQDARKEARAWASKKQDDQKGEKDHDKD